MSYAELISRCRDESLRLLRANAAPLGLRAATPGGLAQRRGYHRIFTRDAAICALGITASGDARLRHAAEMSLLTLAAQQAASGQIPKFVDPERGDADFWYVGCIDATLWWLIARDVLARNGGAEFASRSAEATARAVHWLRCQEHPQLLLLQQNEASDWADIMPRSGFVLYTNALWYEVKKRYGLDDAAHTRRHFNQVFFPFRGEYPDYRRLRLLRHYARRGARNRSLYLSFVNFASWGEEGDTLGNLLAMLFGLADEQMQANIVRTVTDHAADAPYPLRAVCEPIPPGAPLWRPYMARHQQNYPWQYHNGGIWPFIGGFWVAALAARGLRRKAEEALLRLAQANAVGDWAFREWFDGRSGEPHGVHGQSWNAAMFLFACAALRRPGW